MNARPRWSLLLWLVMLLVCAAALRRMPAADATAGSMPDCDTRVTTDIATLEGCLEHDPAAVEVLIDLGVAYEAAARTDRAEAMYRRAIAADPRSSDAHLRLGRLLLARQDRAGARREADAAGRIQPGRAAVRQLAADAAAEGSRR
jgi:tetratricopeptide (TPR) repeat protein